MSFAIWCAHSDHVGRLRNIKPTLGTLAPRLGRLTKPDGHNIDAEPWRRWYWTARWKRLRLVIFKRDHFLCQMCGVFRHDTSKLIADHKKPHKGNAVLFWDPENIQTLCGPCHSGPKQSIEKQAGHATR